MDPIAGPPGEGALRAIDWESLVSLSSFRIDKLCLEESSVLCQAFSSTATLASFLVLVGSITGCRSLRHAQGPGKVSAILGGDCCATLCFFANYEVYARRTACLVRFRHDACRWLRCLLFPSGNFQLLASYSNRQSPGAPCHTFPASLHYSFFPHDKNSNPIMQPAQPQG